MSKFGKGALGGDPVAGASRDLPFAGRAHSRLRIALVLAASPLLATSGNAQLPQRPASPTSSTGTCSAQSAASAGVTLSSVKAVEAGTYDGQPVPAHCQIDGRFEERTGAQGKAYAIGFELRIPRQWNGKLLFQGGGGLNGTLTPALGAVIGSPAATGLARGFAVVSTDSGHLGTDASFAADQLAKLNYAYASIGKVALVAKRLLARLEGSGPKRTYYAGCSNGGREAMLAAERFPEEFDGVIAGSPAFHLSDAVLLDHYSTSVYRDAAPRAADGTIQVPLVLSPADFKLLRRGILNACDGLDGAKDGLVFDHAQCRFDPQVLQCRPRQSTPCLSAAKVRMLHKAFAGPVGRDGKPLLSSWTYDSGIDSDGWRIWQTGLMFNGRPALILPRLIDETLARYFNYPMLDPSGLGPVDTVSMRSAMAPTAALTDATSTQLSSFAAKGGKMLIVSGWSEPVFAPNDLIAWYHKLDRDMTAAAGTPARSFSRLFMVPGMNHCGGGPSLDQFDALAALDAWVEQSRAPDRIIATGKSFPGLSRPLCPYPQFAVYRSGPGESAASYSCESPKLASYRGAKT